MAASFTRLPRSVVVVAGEDRRTFLQGLISNDINKVSAAQAIWSAFLTPQGKFLWDLFICEDGDRFLIDVEADRAEAFKKKLSMYKLRSKVTVEIDGGLSVFAAFGDGALAALGLAPAAGAAKGTCCVDPRLADAGARIVAADPSALVAAGLTEAAFAAWDQARIGLGLPDGSRDIEVEKGILLENGFWELNGVDFDKGCYMGQELTARTRYRGLVRKRLLPVSFEGAAPAPGTPVTAGESDAGEMRGAQGNVGLALLRLEAVRAGKALTCAGQALVYSVPGWVVLPEAE
ncbi:putative aminomethyltransferase folate-binding domain [Magnetospirillum sp. LM-5]|uniref:CAF17-like 4Fe-4S cluster assembly/insertion protein YgfZ n=1 Tax=Magnetospirillum sp. LM-5 TaxID=2681466 RepID=UPI0013838144|nr:folate-binding protein YgfZ [Magnetospirillum sp. LM-5]CAA7619983.1 putative aminomethyltransferase folate-binding domain [Magnetospirillum sp. LM-5]